MIEKLAAVGNFRSNSNLAGEALSATQREDLLRCAI